MPRQLVEGEKAYTRPELYEGDRPRLYLQEGTGPSGTRRRSRGLDDDRVKGKSLAICLDDFDGDGRTDIFVANDTVQNFLFLATGPAQLREAAVAPGVGYDDNGRGARGDGRRLRWTGPQRRAARGRDRELLRRARLALLREGSGGEGRASETRRTRPGSADRRGCRSRSALLRDVDLDGWCDLVLANGHIEPTITRLKPELQYAQSPQLFRNLRGEAVRGRLRRGGPLAADRRPRPRRGRPRRRRRPRPRAHVERRAPARAALRPDARRSCAAAEAASARHEEPGRARRGGPRAARAA